MNILISIFSYFFVFFGILILFSSSIGALRFPKSYSKVHFGGLTDSLGVPMILFGLSIYNRSVPVLKVLLIILIMWICGTTSTYFICRKKDE